MTMTRSAPDMRTDRPDFGSGGRASRLLGLTLALGLVVGLLLVGGRAWSTSGGGVNAVVGPVGECEGQDTAGYANGRIPTRALCPAGWTDRGEEVLLRADAAAELLSLAAAWEAEHGTPLCVRSAYRSSAQQAGLFARMSSRPEPWHWEYEHSPRTFTG
jgi:hypothetical protein